MRGGSRRARKITARLDTIGQVLLLIGQVLLLIGQKAAYETILQKVGALQRHIQPLLEDQRRAAIPAR